ncbi:MAG: helix-turn-helix domain-containing protein [Hyphomicrobiales bacterium]|nr:helix-turn-helix domain-containing protein [Hyphomicrobiales bacterium]
MMSDYSIGHLARQTGYAVQTLRYYEEIGLMPAPPRTGGGQRRYSAAHLERLSFIRHARDLGFDIDAIRALLRLAEHPNAPCTDVDQIALAHLASIDDKIARLQALRREIAQMTESCANRNIANCRVIEVLAEHKQCLHDHH